VGVGGALSLALTLAVAADPSDLPPAGVVGPLPVVHLFASEDLSPDALGALARPEVVLWLATRSNTLRASTVARLARFRESYVQLHSPIKTQDWAQLEAVPRAGVWLSAEAATEPTLFRAGARRRALSLRGPLDASALKAVAAARPVRIRWEPGDPPNLEAWSRFAQLPCARVLVWDGPLGQFSDGCPVSGRPAGLILWADSPRLAAPAALARACGWPLAVRLPGQVGSEWLAGLIGKYPQLDLELEASDDGAATAARGFLDTLEALGPPRGGP
jgi:hypothetical protein